MTGHPPLAFDSRFTDLGLSAYSYVANPAHVTIVDDPVGLPRKVARLDTHDDDLQPTGNPRTQLDPPRFILPGEDWWLGFGLYFPPDWPIVPSGGWQTFASVYGPHYSGTSALTLNQAGDRIRVQRNARYGWDEPMSTPIRRGRWMDWALHFVLSADPAVGFYEVWLNTGDGWAQRPLAGRARLRFQTLDETHDDGPNYAHLTNYRTAGMWPGAHALCVAEHRIGSCLVTVDPASYDHA
jgi:hypothetical protein